MSAEDLMARIEEAKSDLQTAKEMLSEARSTSGLTQEGLFSEVTDTITTITDDVVEPIATTAVGTILGARTGGTYGALAGSFLGPFGVVQGAIIGTGVGGVMGGINGAFTGTRNIYDWSSSEGRRAFVADSTHGLLGTSLGNISNIYNSVVAPSSYRSDLSERQNRQVYDEGLYFEKNSALTLGNVVSNLEGRDPSSGSDLLAHETVHIEQNRAYGAFYPLSYAAFSAIGFVEGLIAAPSTEQPWTEDVRDEAYVNNPWERQAYEYGGDSGGGELAHDDS
jgi:hypothetical protein